jgi:FMN-dependent NADH-azoreductase
MKLLHIVATPRGHTSNTLGIAKHLIDQLNKKYADLEIEELNLFDEDLPAIAGANIEAKYTLLSRQELDDIKRRSWSLVEAKIFQFARNDIYVITAPMWNLSIPYILKFYIDTIVQPNYLFRYNEQGQLEGMIHGKKMFCVTSRGGDYAPGTPGHAFDFQEPYLRAIFGMCGIIDMSFINAQPMDVTIEMREAGIAAALKSAEELVAAMDFVPLEQ